MLVRFVLRVEHRDEIELHLAQVRRAVAELHGDDEVQVGVAHRRRELVLVLDDVDVVAEVRQRVIPGDEVARVVEAQREAREVLELVRVAAVVVLHLLARALLALDARAVGELDPRVLGRAGAGCCRNESFGSTTHSLAMSFIRICCASFAFA